MKENCIRVSTHPKFREMLTLEAKANGMSVPKFTQQLAEDKSSISDIVEEWKEKWNSKVKRTKGGFDFP